LKKLTPGVEFEKIVRDIQSQFDEKAEVSHDETLIDRLGHKRQFDVVVRGKFAGQDILGVIECKDLNKKLGTPGIDAFVTKSQDINANFKIMVSRKGFSKPAIEKGKHYGIQTFSLLPGEEDKLGFIVGTKWFADIYYWRKFAVTLQFVDPPEGKIEFNAEEVAINGKKVLDGFKNYLLAEHPTPAKEGWVVNVRVEFDAHQTVYVNNAESYKCYAIDFSAYRAVDRREKIVGMSGTGFFDWQKSQATFPAGANITSHAVKADFVNWDKRTEENDRDNGFVIMTFIVHMSQFEKNDDAIDLDSL